MAVIAAALEPLGESLRRLLATSSVPGGTLERSYVDFTLKADWAVRPLSEAYSLAGMNLGHTADHLMGAAACIRAGAISYSVVTLVRAGLESAAQTFYLMAGEIGTRERVRRWANLLLQSDMESLRLLQGLAHPEPAAETELHERMDRIVKSARQHAFQVTDLRDSPKMRERLRPPHLDHSLPSTMSMINDLLSTPGRATGSKSGETTYRALSAVAHSQMHGLRQFWMRDTAAAAKDPGMMTLSYGVTGPQLVFWLTPLVLAAVSVGQLRSTALGQPAHEWPASTAPILLQWQNWMNAR